MKLQDEIEKTEKEIRETQSPYRKKDLIKYLLKLKRKVKDETRKNK